MAMFKGHSDEIFINNTGRPKSLLGISFSIFSSFLFDSIGFFKKIGKHIELKYLSIGITSS
jgi:hypothetical protein